MSLSRLLAILLKEFRQIRRDRLTFAMMVIVPIMQLILFGFAINSDPKHLPLALVANDQSEFTRNLISGLENSEYFRIEARTQREAEADALLDAGEVQFVLVIGPDFTRQLLRGEQPKLLLAADAADPSASGNALAGLDAIIRNALAKDGKGMLAQLGSTGSAVDLRVQRRYNPDGLTSYNIVPGLVGVIMTMTMIMMTALAMTREKERGTMENLLATPVRPIEVMIGKIVPYILIGYMQAGLVLVAAKIIFDIPMLGNLVLLTAALAVYMVANLAIGFTFSTVARNQLQAMQLTFFYFLPSILLSGFMFPFRGMPNWAQTLGEAFPLTHFLRIIRGILLKGNGLVEVFPHVWPMLLFLLVVGSVALSRYRQTLD